MNVDDWANRISEDDVFGELEAALRDDPELSSAKTSLGDTLLHEACAHKRLALVDLLLAAGADVNARGDHGRTPLHRAVHDAPLAKALPIVRRLVEHRAVCDLEDEIGFTVAEHAAQEIWDDPEPVLLVLGTSLAKEGLAGRDIATIAARPDDIEARAHTAVSILRLLEAFRDARELGPAITQEYPAANMRCVEDLRHILDTIAATSWGAAARGVLRMRFKGGHVHRLMNAYFAPNRG